MANFRTTQDLLDGVLRRSGEMTSSQGTSPLTDDALLYMNQIYSSIICGGIELDTEIDESWVWAKNRRPCTFKLEAPFVTSISLSTGSTAGTLSALPTSGITKDWYLQLQGVPALYRVITDPNGYVVTLDQPYVAASNYSGTCTLFKLEYDIFPDVFVIDQDNYGVEFTTTGTAGTQSNISYLSYGSYAMSQNSSALLTTVIAEMTADNTNNVTFNGTYDSDLRKVTITKSQVGTTATTFTLVGNGTSANNSIWTELGYDCLSYSGSSSYTSAYPLYATARLASPGRIHSNSGPLEVRNIDGIQFEREFPLAHTEQGVPSAFTVTYEREGFIRIRFNRYPSEAMRFEIETIPYPRALQNNSGSIPRMPQKLTRILEYGAAYYLCLDKDHAEKASVWMAEARKLLTAMVKTNRQDLLKTGANFGAVVARPDLMPDRGIPNYLRTSRYGYDDGTW